LLERTLFSKYRKGVLLKEGRVALCKIELDLRVYEDAQAPEFRGGRELLQKV
jgi:hypothetical protein